jgi:hypothetical protein
VDENIYILKNIQFIRQKSKQNKVLWNPIYRLTLQKSWRILAGIDRGFPVLRILSFFCQAAARMNTRSHNISIQSKVMV